jgi:hypothetical protein
MFKFSKFVKLFENSETKPVTKKIMKYMIKEGIIKNTVLYFKNKIILFFLKKITNKLIKIGITR